MPHKLTLLDVHDFINDTRRPEKSRSINDFIIQLERLTDQVSHCYTKEDDSIEAYRAIWNCGLSETLTRDGDAETYWRILRNRDVYGYRHVDEKTTYYCVLAELFREEGEFGKALSILQGIRTDLTVAKRDEFVDSGLYDVDQLIVLNERKQKHL